MKEKLVREDCVECQGEDCETCVHCINGYRYFWVWKRSKYLAREIEGLLRARPKVGK